MKEEQRLINEQNKARLDLAAQRAKLADLEEKGIGKPWITFKIPYIVPLTLAFIASAIFGDLFSAYLVEPINSFFN